MIRVTGSRRIGVRLGKTGRSPHAQARIDAIIGPGLDIAEISFTAYGLIQIEVETPSATLGETKT